MTTKNNDKFPIREVRHMITYDCVFRCLHCYMSGGNHPDIQTNHFTQEQADKFYSYFKPESVSATGGEPLLEPELVKIITKSIVKYGGELELVTNGLLLTENFVKELNDLNPHTSFQISFDGSEKLHDHMRQHQGAYQAAVKAIDLCSGLGNSTKARMTVTSENYSQIPEVIKTLDQFQRKDIKLIMRVALNTGRAYKNHLGFSYNLSSELKKYQSLAKFITVSITDRCGYCLDSLTVDPKGDIYPCCYFTFNPEYKMGSMFDDPRKLRAQPEFASYTGKCFAMEKFSSASKPDDRCTTCIEEEYLKISK